MGLNKDLQYTANAVSVIPQAMNWVLEINWLHKPTGLSLPRPRVQQRTSDLGSGSRCSRQSIFWLWLGNGPHVAIFVLLPLSSVVHIV